MAETKKKQKKHKRFYDYSLVAVIMFICVFGLIIVYSSSSYSALLKTGDSLYYFKRQGMILAAGFVAMIAVSKVDYHFYMKFVIPIYLLSIVLMVLTNWTSLGIELNGQKRWLGVTENLSFQPSEFVKIAIILTMTAWANKIGRNMDRVIGLIIAGILAVIPFVLVALNNLSAGIIIAAIAIIICFVASRNKALFALGVLVVGLVAFVFVQFTDKLMEMGIMEEYRLMRILVWKNPEAYATGKGFQVLQGLYAIGSGGFFGRGLGGSIQKLGFIPEAMNDMVFSIICEELGLFGAICVLMLFFFVIWRFMVIANNAPDLTGALIVVGVMAQIGVQVILNVAVVTNSIPNTGISLPFISYGGTSVLFLMAEMGMVLGVANRIGWEEA